VRSRWTKPHGGDESSPVEMRFIDMFMTALGALVFLALILVFLLPKVETSKSNKTIDDLTAKVKELEKTTSEQKAEIERLTSQIWRQGQPGTLSEDKNVVLRWFAVFIVAQSCGANEPVLHVRAEGEIIDFETGKSLPDAEPFDASNPVAKTWLVGQRYLDVGDGREDPATGTAPQTEKPAAGLQVLTRNALHAKLFYGGPHVGFYSIYVGLRQPLSSSGACTISPFYLSARGLIQGEKINLKPEQPFAWLRRFRLNADGSTTFGTPPRADEDFKRDLAEFSDAQSKLLCAAKKGCRTMDAHYAILRSETSEAGKPFRDCDDDQCPWLVAVPKGGFSRGSSTDPEANTNESPVFRVNFERPFAVGRFAVTFAEWDACVQERACRRADDKWGRGRHPVINVSWNDTKDYLKWLSAKTGKTYRLLTEAEREYVTRATTVTPFWWGSAITTDQANYDGKNTQVYKGGGSPGLYRERTEVVDAFKPNAWNLYQVHGNVWEWTEDCYEDSYSRAPTDGSAVRSGPCTQRVIRGGSWRNKPSLLRSAARAAYDTGNRADNIGFRVARDLR